MKTLLLTASAALLLAAPLTGQRRPPDPRDMGGGRCDANVYNCADTPNPLAPNPSIWIEEMTWMDVRDALAAGKTTVIISTGGIEANGPWLATGKHNYVLNANCEAIARELGDALCAPVIPFVPEGNIDPPTGHMRTPGTISARQETFEALLTDVARSMKAHGFEAIVFIGDSGGNQNGQRAVAERLTDEWGGTPVVAHIQAYYDNAGMERFFQEEMGVPWPRRDGLHDQPEISVNMFVDDPRSLRWRERVDAGLASINGVPLDDRVQVLEWGRAMVAHRAGGAAAAIRDAIVRGGTAPPPARPQRTQAAARPTAQAPRRPEPDPRDMGGGPCADNAYNCADTPNPLHPNPSVWIEELTWMDVRDALAGGSTTAIIPTGGVEPNGPWLATGKHNYVLEANCEAIARELGNALCAPVVKWVPEGALEPASGHMRSPGTISVRQETFEALLTDIAESLAVHGFEHIVFIGDSGSNRRGMSAVAEKLDAAWGGKVRAFLVAEYYPATPEPTEGVLASRGLIAPDQEGSDGLHDNPTITLNMMVADIESVRWSERVRADQATIDGFSIADLERSLALGREISEARAKRTADAIRRRTEGM